GQYYVNGINEEYVSYETDDIAIAPEGVYAVDLNALDGVTGEDTFGTSGPFYIKSTPSEITFDDFEESADVVTGTIDDLFVDFKDEVDWENIFGVDYDVNENLTVAFTLTDENDEVVAEGDVTLDDEGNFEVPLEDLTDGEYTLTLSVEDIAQNTAEESVIINVTGEEPEEPEEPEVPEEIEITLTPSTTEPT